ncbi:MAG: ATP-binding protein [Cyanobacteria bacterium P01_F01_bin.150]
MNYSSQDPTIERDRPQSSHPPPDFRDTEQRQKWHRLWPQSIPGRLLVMFAVGLLIAQSLTGVLYWNDRQLNTAPNRVRTISNQIIAIADLVDLTPPAQQELVLNALNSPMLHVEVLSEAPEYLSRLLAKREGGIDQPIGLADGRPKPRLSGSNAHSSENRFSKSNALQKRAVGPFRKRHLLQFQVYLNDAINAPVFITARPAARHKKRPPRQIDGTPSRSLERQSLLPSRYRLVVAIDQNPQWLVLTLPIGFGSRHHGPRFPAILLVMGLLIWLLLAWATRRITNPLLRFAAAADRLGLDVNAPPLSEQGSKELRQASQAFNRMQGRLQRLIRDRTFMLAAISHDLRTILTRLRLRTEFMEDPTQQQKVQDDLSQMEIMLNSTLNFAKEDSTPEARTTFDLSSLLQSICDDLGDAGHRVVYSSRDRVTLQGQPTALRRAFTNLIENAAIYGQRADVTVRSGNAIQIEGNDGVEIAIADRGPGIAPEMREQVFKPFFRLERSRNRETGGTGLGMAVARTVVRRHGGNIILRNYPDPNAINQPDGGLLIVVQLPKT